MMPTSAMSSVAPSGVAARGISARAVERPLGSKMPSRRSCERAKQIVDVLARADAAKARWPRARDTAASGAARRRRHEARRATCLSRYFSSQRLHLQRRRQRDANCDDAWIEEREAAFDAVRHRNAVALRRQDVAGQQLRHLEVLRSGRRIPRARTPPAAARRTPRGRRSRQCADCISSGEKASSAATSRASAAGARSTGRARHRAHASKNARSDAGGWRCSAGEIRIEPPQQRARRAETRDASPRSGGPSLP